MEEMIFRSETYGHVNLSDIPYKLNEYYKKNSHWGTEFQIVIGTDSQNHNDTKVVTVIAIICEGHGGIYFSHIKHTNKIKSVKEKLHFETGDSLLVAMKLLEIMENSEELEDLYMNAPMSIHIDAGTSPKGKTYSLINELTGWVNSTGFDCEIKPESFVASSIADKISK